MRTGLTVASTLAALLLLGGCDVAAGPAGASRRPDVVLLTVDTLRADRLSSYGYARETSPFIDRLADEGALFEDVTSQFSWTVPSMVSVFTGRYLTEKCVEIPLDEHTLAQAFRRAGYRTIGVVANVLLQADVGFARGFDRFVAPATETFARAEWTLDDLMERALPLLEEAAAGKERRPVLLYLHAMEPHSPYAPPEVLDPAASAFPTPDASFQPGGWHARRLEELGVTDDAPVLLERARELRRGYDREVRALDHQLERAFERLDALGLLDHAVFALMSDHGEGLWDHCSPPQILGPAVADRDAIDSKRIFYQKHGAILYQEVAHTPLVLWGAGVPRGVRVDHAVENVDLFPTLLELADLPATGALHGRSLAPGLHGRPVEPREFAYALGAGASMVRELATDLKLIVHGEVLELYDLAADPGERVDLAAARPGDVARLLDALKAWARAHPVGESAAPDRRLHERLDAIGYTQDDVGLDR